MTDPLLIDVQLTTPQEWLDMGEEELADNVLIVLNSIRSQLNQPTLAALPQGDRSSQGNPLSLALPGLYSYPNRELGSAFCMTADRELGRAMFVAKGVANPREFNMVSDGPPWWDMALRAPLALFLCRFHHGQYPQLMLAAEAMAA